MATNLIHDRGRGPEIDGTRITVYNLLSDLLDPTATMAAGIKSHTLLSPTGRPTCSPGRTRTAGRDLLAGRVERG
jgi:hypothetical protein